jgi:hypothetical protein
MRATLLTCVCALALCAGRGHGDEGKGEFFNGKDATGWEGLLQYWTIKDGALIGSSYPDGLKFNTFLCSKQKYRDFELKFEVKIKGEDAKMANSGVQIRSYIEDKHRDQFRVSGPQCDIGTAGGRPYWGSLYGENFGGMMKEAPKEVVAKALKPDDFNEYAIKCVGKRVTVKLNGETTVDGEFEKMPDEGIIAWQLHGGKATEVTFRNIQFKDLSAK